MKSIILRITHCNWSLMGPGDWNNTEWIIYDDFTVEVAEKYNELDINDFSSSMKYMFKLTDKQYEMILKNIESAKSDTTIVDGCDGDAWEYIQFENNKEIWKRELGYIYGIKSLENIEKILNKK